MSHSVSFAGHADREDTSSKHHKIHTHHLWGWVGQCKSLEKILQDHHASLLDVGGYWMLIKAVDALLRGCSQVIPVTVHFGDRRR